MELLTPSPLPALILKSGDTEISKITPLNTSPFLIGRGAESSLKLRHKAVSRKQCSIERNGSDWVIKSLGSRPLMINDHLLFEDNIKILKCSDIIELAGVSFEFRCSPDQNGRCCESSEPNMSAVSVNDSCDLTRAPKPFCSSKPNLNCSSSIDRPSIDLPWSVAENAQSFNTDDLVNVNIVSDPVSISSTVSPSNSESILDTDQFTEIILMFANHLEDNNNVGTVDTNYSRLSDKLRLRLEFAESIDKYGVDESCEAHIRKGNIGSLSDAVRKLSSVLDTKCNVSPEFMEVAGSNFYENLERLFSSIDVLLTNNVKETVNRMDKLPESSNEKKISRVCCCLQRNRQVMNKKPEEPISADVSDHTDDENDIKNKVKWQEAKIQYLQMKLKEKENVSNQLESMKQQNDVHLKEIATLKRTLANKDIMELELRVLQETIKYKEEDKRSKDILQERIDSLQSERTNLKIENEKLMVDLEKTKNEITEMTEKCQKLEEKLNEKTKSPLISASLEGANVEDQCCELGGAKTSRLIELIERELNCSICGEMFIEATVTNCNHAFCTHCLDEWKKMKRECPFCRTIIVKECKISFLDEFINSLLELFSQKMLAERLRLVQERKTPPVGPPPAKRARQPARGRRSTRARNAPNQYHIDPRVVNIP